MTALKYPLALDTWGEDERNAVKRVVDSTRITIGPEVADLEKEFAAYHDLHMSVACNSGSSANLLAVAALATADGRRGRWLVPALGWATTYAPLHQLGHSFVVVDVDPCLGISVDQCRRALADHPDIIGICAVNVLGVCADLPALRQLADQHGLWFVEDNCESLGAMIGGQYAGTWGDLGTFSFYFSHHITTGEGGMVLVRNPYLFNLLRSLRSHGWTRGIPGLGNAADQGGRYAPFNFVIPGYNFRMMDLQAAPGRVQLRRLREMVAVRELNLMNGWTAVGGIKGLTLQQLRGKVSPMAFAMRYDKPDFTDFLGRLDAAGVEHRPLIGGNILRQPVAKHYNIVAYPTPMADAWHDRGLYVGIYGTKMDLALFEELRKCAA